MPEPSYHAPATLPDAISVLGKFPGGRILAGGTDLLVQMRSANPLPTHIIDIKHLPGLIDVQLTADTLHLGAAAPAQSITERSDIQALFPGLVEAIDLIGSTQIQGRCSVGGNLCNASPAADTVPALIANGAICHVLGPDGTREIAVEMFNQGPGQNGLASNEILTGITLARPAPGTADAYLRFTPRTEMDIAVAGAGVSITLNEEHICTAAHIAIGAVGPTALTVPNAAAALVGTSLDETALRAAAHAASDIATPISDKRGTAEFRRKVVGVLTRRAIAIARDRAIDSLNQGGKP